MTVRRTTVAETGAKRPRKVAREAGSPVEARERLASARGFAAALDRKRLLLVDGKNYAEVAGPAVYRRPRKKNNGKPRLRTAK